MAKITNGLAAYNAYKILIESFNGDDFNVWYNFVSNYAGLGKQDVHLPKFGDKDVLKRLKILMRWYFELYTLKGFVRREDVNVRLNEANGPNTLLACNSEGLGLRWPTTSFVINRAFQNAYNAQLIMADRQERELIIRQTEAAKTQMQIYEARLYEAETKLDRAERDLMAAQNAAQKPFERIKKIFRRDHTDPPFLREASEAHAAAAKALRTQKRMGIEIPLPYPPRITRELPPIAYLRTETATLAARRCDALVDVPPCDVLFTLPRLPLEFKRGTEGVFKINFATLNRVKPILIAMGIGGRSGDGSAAAGLEAVHAGGQFYEFINTEIVNVLKNSKLSTHEEEAQLAGWGLVSAYLAYELTTSLGACNNGLAGSLWYLLWHLANESVPGCDGLSCISTLFEESQRGHQWHRAHGFSEL